MQSSDSQPMTREEYRKSEIEIIRKELKKKAIESRQQSAHNYIKQWFSI